MVTKWRIELWCGALLVRPPATSASGSALHAAASTEAPTKDTYYSTDKESASGKD
jgi:hypothetical protein